MDNLQSQLIKKYLDLFWRRKLFISIVFLISLPVGLAAYLSVPKVYEATSLLSYQQQHLSPNKLSPDIKGKLSDIVSTLSKIVISRNNLEEFIISFGLYPEERKKMPIEDVIEIMRENISIVPSKRGETFQITFEGADPRKVVRVTSALAAAFITENLQYRQERATETSSYTRDELRMAKIVMDEQELAMRDYKLEHYNEMPDQQDNNAIRLIALQEQYQGKQESIPDLQRTLVMVRNSINTHSQNLERSNYLKGQNGLDVKSKNSTESPRVKLDRLRIVLKNLQDRYTERHPDVKKVSQQIAKLESEIAEAGEDAVDAEIATEAAKGISVNNWLLSLQAQELNVQNTIKEIELEKVRLRETIAKYEKWVSVAPVTEAEWATLTREYGQLNKHYEYLVGRNLEAKSMVNLERRQQGSQFKIEDPARMPTTPTKPNFIKFMALAIVGGLGVGVGISLVLDFTDGTFRNAGQIESFLDLPVVGVISYIATDDEKRKSLLWRILQSLIILLMQIAIAGVFLFAWFKGLIIL